MAITFEVAKKELPDNSSTIAADIKTWLDSLNITTVHAVGITHVQGFWHILIIYE